MLNIYPPVRIDLMRAALTNFYAVMQRDRPKGKRWSGKAQDAVSAASQDDRSNWLSYIQRCFAFHKMTKNGLPQGLKEWIQADGSLDGVLIDFVALAPLRRDNKFRIKEFRATVNQLSSKTPLSTSARSG
jgi:hypothetical protein